MSLVASSYSQNHNYSWLQRRRSNWIRCWFSFFVAFEFCLLRLKVSPFWAGLVFRQKSGWDYSGDYLCWDSRCLKRKTSFTEQARVGASDYCCVFHRRYVCVFSWRRNKFQPQIAPPSVNIRNCYFFRRNFKDYAKSFAFIPKWTLRLTHKCAADHG